MGKNGKKNKLVRTYYDFFCTDTPATAPHTRSVPLQGIALQGYAPSLFTFSLACLPRGSRTAPNRPLYLP